MNIEGMNIYRRICIWGRHSGRLNRIANERSGKMERIVNEGIESLAGEAL